MPFSTPAAVSAETFTTSTQPAIETGDGLRLRPWEHAAAPAVLEAFTDPAICYWHARTASSVEEVGTWIASWVADWSGAVHAHWAVANSETNALLGTISLKAMDLRDGQAGVAYWTMPNARGKTVAPRAAAAVTGWAFDELGFHRLQLTHSVDNAPSCRVAVKAGFPLEGTKRSAALHADGWHDMHLHARLAQGSQGAACRRQPR